LINESDNIATSLSGLPALPVTGRTRWTK